MVVEPPYTVLPSFMSLMTVLKCMAGHIIQIQFLAPALSYLSAKRYRIRPNIRGAQFSRFFADVTMAIRQSAKIVRLKIWT